MRTSVFKVGYGTVHSQGEKTCLSTTENGRRSAAMKTPINLVMAFAFLNSQTGVVEIAS